VNDCNKKHGRGHLLLKKWPLEADHPKSDMRGMWNNLHGPSAWTKILFEGVFWQVKAWGQSGTHRKDLPRMRREVERLAFKSIAVLLEGMSF